MVGVEIGSFAGISSEVFSYFCKSLTCIDPWDMAFEKENYREIIAHKLASAEKEFDSLVSRSSNIKKIKGFSNIECKKFDNESLDFVYIDGNHSNDSVKEDIACWMPKVKKGGVLLGHDYGLICRVFVDLKVKVNKIYSDSSWVIKVDEKIAKTVENSFAEIVKTKNNLKLNENKKVEQEVVNLNQKIIECSNMIDILYEKILELNNKLNKNIKLRKKKK